MNREPLGKIDLSVRDQLDRGWADRRFNSGRVLGRIYVVHLAWMGQILAGFGEHSLELLLIVTKCGFRLLEADIAATDERFCVELASAALLINKFVHLWLCETWLITLVVSTAAIAHEIDNHIFLKCLAIFICKSSNSYN